MCLQEDDIMDDKLHTLKENFSRRKIFLSFSGPLSQNLLTEIGDTLKQKMKLEEASKSTAIRVFSLLVENVQNIIHYSAERVPEEKNGTGKDRELRLGLITVGHENSHYFVLCGNMIENENVAVFSEKLMRIRRMNKDELRAYYKERKRSPGKKNDGGLGFIEMARRASRPIEFDFKKIDEKFSFFSVKIVI